jgi:hypothetical protein
MRSKCLLPYRWCYRILWQPYPGFKFEDSISFLVFCVKPLCLFTVACLPIACWLGVCSVWEFHIICLYFIKHCRCKFVDIGLARGTDEVSRLCEFCLFGPLFHFFDRLVLVALVVLIVYDVAAILNLCATLKVSPSATKVSPIRPEPSSGFRGCDIWFLGSFFVPGTTFR